MKNESVHFLNGKYVKETGLLISVRDIGFLRGYAVFDFLVTYPTRRPFMLDRHIDRFFNSAQRISLALPYSKQDLTKWIYDTLDANRGEDEKSIRIIASGGVGISMEPAKEPTLAIIIDPRHSIPGSHYAQGASVIMVKHQRYDPEAKTNNYIEGVKQMQRAHSVGAVEPVYYTDEQVLEGSNSNICAVIDGRLLTPASGVLNGITRDVLFEIADVSVPMVKQNFSLADLYRASEVFLTGSAKEIMPVVRIDDHTVGNGHVGSITQQLMSRFKDFTLSNRW